MNNRFKGFGLGSKRKSSANNAVPQGAPAARPQPQYIAPQIPIRPDLPSTPSSTSSSIQMSHPGAGQRPPSYTPTYPPGSLGARTTSPPMPPGPGNPRTPPTQVMGGPPPIQTNNPGGYPPPSGPLGAPPLHGGPPQYGGQPYPGPGQGPMGGSVPYVARNNAVEVEGAGRSKSQLIVGIDFVCMPERSQLLQH